MAQRTVIQLTDDLDGTAIADGQGETVTFGLDGAVYEIDLNAKNAAKLRDSLSKYVSAGRRTSGRRSSGKQARDYDAKSVRKWAEANKIDVPARGRIPVSVIEQFKAAGN